MVIFRRSVAPVYPATADGMDVEAHLNNSDILQDVPEPPPCLEEISLS